MSPSPIVLVLLLGGVILSRLAKEPQLGRRPEVRPGAGHAHRAGPCPARRRMRRYPIARPVVPSLPDGPTPAVRVAHGHCRGRLAIYSGIITGLSLTDDEIAQVMEHETRSRTFSRSTVPSACRLRWPRTRSMYRCAAAREGGRNRAGRHASTEQPKAGVGGRSHRDRTGREGRA